MNLILAALVLASACDAPKKSSESKSAATAKAPEAPPVLAAPTIEVTAGQLFSDYAGDPGAADAKYFRKRLRVQGLVERDSGDLIQLVAGGGQSTVNAWLSDDAPKRPRASRPKHDDVVSLACTGNGILAVPELKDCMLETGTPAPK